MYDKIIFGSIAGIISSTICYPLDTIKVISQSRIKHSSIITFYKKNGISGFYRGLMLNNIAMGAFYGIFFPLYEYNKRILPIKNEIILHATSSYLSSIAASTIINPIYVMKTVKQVNTSKNVGLCKGLTLTYIKNLEVGLQLSLFEYLKKKEYSTLTSSLIAKGISTTITYPIDTIRTIRRSGNKISIRDIYYRSGIKAFFNGYVYNSMRSIPTSVIALNVNYLLVKNYT